MLSQTGRPAEAEAEYRTALAILAALAEANPAVADFRNNLASIHHNLGLLLGGMGRPAEAEAEYRRALAVFQGLIEVNPKVPDYHHYLAQTHCGLGDLARGRGRAGEARAAYDQAIEILVRLAQENPTIATYRTSLAHSWQRRGLAFRDLLGDPAEAVADARRALELLDGLPSKVSGDWFETACCRAVLAGLAGRAGSGMLAGEAASEADAAIALLHKAVGLGYRDVDALRTEPALDPLRSRPDFQALLMDLALPDHPFAPDE